MSRRLSHVRMHQTESQEEVFGLLSAPATHGGATVRRIDTHAAAVFLAGDRVYKVKRAVKFPFLDFSDAAKRKAACEAELEANRPFAPQLYRRVVAITREADGRLALDGMGEPTEWAVEMYRFDENATLDRLADRGIDLPLADALARAVAAAHRKAPVVDAEPWLDALGDFIGQNDAAFCAAPDLFPKFFIIQGAKGRFNSLLPQIFRHRLDLYKGFGHTRVRSDDWFLRHERVGHGQVIIRDTSTQVNK